MRSRWGFVVWTVVAVIMQHFFVFSALISKPLNTVSVVGNRTKIECSRNSHVLYPVDWEFASVGSNHFSFIYTSKRITENLTSRYKIDTDSRTRYDIIIDSVDLSHAGTYRCTPISEELISASAQLTVLASDPICNTNASVLNGHIPEREYIGIWCTVNYTGNWIPVMEWTRSNGKAVDANITYTNTSSTLKASIIIQLNSSDNGETFMCNTSFKLASTKISRTLKPNETLATNVPHYQQLWNFKANVSYAPRDLTIQPKNSDYKVGDRLVCSASGNPQPTYEWMDVETNITIHEGSELTIDDNMSSDKNHSFRCTASNAVANFKKQTFDTVTFTVTVTGRHRFTTEQYIIISIIVVGSLCCLVLTFYLYNNRCPYKIGIARHEPDILQAVQINPYDIAESPEDHPTDQLRSVQPVHPPAVEGGNFQQRLPLPVYADVRRKENKVVTDLSERQPFQPLSPVYSPVKKEIRDDETRSATEGVTEHLSRHQGLPVYTDVMKNRNGSKNSDGPRQTAQATVAQYRLPPRTLTGADGTQYMDVTSMREINETIRHPPMFSVVETYASIDHTVDVPPPLPPKRQ